MKIHPIVICKELNENSKFEFTKEELEALITSVYEQGYQQGWSDARPVTINGYSGGSSTMLLKECDMQLS